MSPTCAIPVVTNDIHLGDEELTMDETRHHYNPALRWVGYLACTSRHPLDHADGLVREQRAMSPHGTIQ